jgi:hypothetical protein
MSENVFTWIGSGPEARPDWSDPRNWIGLDGGQRSPDVSAEVKLGHTSASAESADKSAYGTQSET